MTWSAHTGRRELKSERDFVSAAQTAGRGFEKRGVAMSNRGMAAPPMLVRDARAGGLGRHNAGRSMVARRELVEDYGHVQQSARTFDLQHSRVTRTERFKMSSESKHTADRALVERMNNVSRK